MIIVFSLFDIFDMIGIFIGIGCCIGIFLKEDEIVLEDGCGFKIKMDKVLFVDVIVIFVGVIFGILNIIIYVEFVVGIGAGGCIGLILVVVVVLFVLSSLFFLLIVIVLN